VVDYVINKHYDAYVGLNWSEVADGLASGFPGTPGKDAITGSQNQTTAMVGFRVKF
jgi:predicted porin